MTRFGLIRHCIIIAGSGFIAGGSLIRAITSDDRMWWLAFASWLLSAAAWTWSLARQAARKERAYELTPCDRELLDDIARAIPKKEEL